MRFPHILNRASQLIPGVTAALLSLSIVHSAFAGEPAQHPVVIGNSVKPIMMLNMSRDHQLFFKLYDDYSDITRPDGGGPDGRADITYNNNYDYFGYFDQAKCYAYDNLTTKRFNPVGWRNTTTRSCDGTEDWSGNFLNWATMTRVDAIRKILYGGHRVVDAVASGTDNSVTVLERAFLPNDAHSFAKYYLPDTDVQANLRKVIPDAAASSAAQIDTNNNNRARGITICNTTDPSSRALPADANALSLSQNVTEPPLMKVAIGNYQLWANNERWQCLWREDMTSAPNNVMRAGGKGTNGNRSNDSGLFAYSDSPQRSTAYDIGNFNVRVSVCVPGLLANGADNEKCQEYSPRNIKPTGLLHKYGEKDLIHFGLLTGSYTKNKSGGVLRKPVRSFSDEIDVATGKFILPTDNLSIVSTLNLLRIFGYSYAAEDGLYNLPPRPPAAWNAVPTDNPSYSDNCSWFGFDNTTRGVSPNSRAWFEDGRCTNWGNPQAEIYLESLRYLAGKESASTAFFAEDTAKIRGLTVAPSAWVDPVSESASGNYCAPLNVLQFNSSITSYDGDQLTGAADIGMTGTRSPSATTKIVGDNEGISGHNYFVGRKNGTTRTEDVNQLCDAKNVTDLSAVDGICPEGPRLEGSYQIAGLAYYARSVGLPAKVAAYGREKVRTFGVALAPAVPKVSVPVGENSFTILPACRNLSTASGIGANYANLPGNCAIVDFKVVENYTAENGGKVYVSWEDMEQGGDYDQDMWGTISYKVTSGNILEVTTDVISQSASGRLGFGYIISGVGTHTYSDATTGNVRITTRGGFNVHSGINGFTTTNSGCLTACNSADVATVRKYQISSDATGTETQSLKDPLYYAAKWGGYSKKFEEDAVKANMDLATAIRNGNSVNESYAYVTDPRELERSLDALMSDAAKAVGSSATAAANSTRLDGETHVYQALFNSEDWSGELLAFKVNQEDGSVDTHPSNATWKASSTMSRTGRVIYTYDGATTKSLVNLTSAGINSAPTLKNALKLPGETSFSEAEVRFRWLLGEENTKLRRRTNILGDIVNSDPAFAGPGNMRFRSLPPEYGSASFMDFVAAKRETFPDGSYKWRSLLLVGANDGMMHAFDANTGAEVFAYIPRGVYPKLANLSSPNYRHQFLVDGPVSVGDVYIQPPNGSAKEWRTVAVGTLGAGGRGAYALDITEVLRSPSGTPTVIFDLTANDLAGNGTSLATYAPYLGYSMSKPMIVPTRDLNWKIIFANGPNSLNGTASLIAVDPASPSNVRVIDTGAKLSTTSTDNGLFGLALLPDANGVSEAAYGGDLMGNMWKFDLSNANASRWDVAYKNGTTNLPLVRVVDATGRAQPITASPTLGTNSLKRVRNGSITVPATMVYFGTGKYYESTDPSNTQVQTVYGIADVESLILSNNSDRTNRLQIKEITSQSEVSGTMTRVVSNDATAANGTRAVDWNTKFGWFMDLKYGAAAGERVLSKPSLLFDRLIFPTFIPSTNQCDYGGEGWLMELTAVGDKYVGKNVLRARNIKLDRPILGDLIALTAGENLFIIGSDLGTKDEHPSIQSKDGNNFADNGRISWQQLR